MVTPLFLSYCLHCSVTIAVVFKLEFTLKMWSFAFSSPVELFCKFTCNEGLSNFRFIPTLNNITVDYTTDRKVTKQQFKFLLDKSVAASCILFICLC